MNAKSYVKFLIISVIFLLGGSALGGTLGNAFTYQGQLKQSGAPFDGTAHLRFSLWDAAGNGSPPVGGSQIGASQLLANVTVTNGLFTILLNAGSQFGANAFNGEARWLQVEVCADAGCGTLTILAPRQPLTAAPHALFALNASAATTATTAANTTQLNGQPATFYQNASNISNGTLTDLRLSSNVALLNTAQTFSAGKTFSAAPSFTGAGSPFSVTSTTLVANLNADRLDGLDSTAFLQSISNPLTLSGTSNSHIIRGENAATNINSTGLLGVSTAASGATRGVYGQSESTSGRGVYGSASAASGTTYGVYGVSLSTSGRGVYGIASAATGTTYGGRFENQSDSGIGASGLGTAVTGVTYGLYGESRSTSGTGVFGEATAATGLTYGVSGQSDSTDGSGVLGLANAASGITYGGNFRSDSTDGTGVSGLATAATGETYGLYGESRSTFGTGVMGYANAASGTNYGGNFRSRSTSGLGVYGLASSTTGTTDGVRGTATSDSGRGVVGWATSLVGTTRGVYGRSDSTSGNGVYGLATADTGDTYGGRFASDSTNGTGVFGWTTAGTGDTNGGRFESDSMSGNGVYCAATADSGTTYGVYSLSTSTSGRGVLGWATSATGSTYGVRGVVHADNSNGYGVYSAGDMGASGTKPFRIDHPDDPGNKYLLHYAAESSEVINFYRGTVVLDDAGEAVVELPHYFAKINKTPSYQLTAVGAPMPMLHVAGEIDEAALSAGATSGPGVVAPICSFRIAGGAPGARVSWRVEAVRNDLWCRKRAVPTETLRNGQWIQTRAMPVEVEKQGVEKGTYQHPELYAQSAELGMDYRKRPEAHEPSSLPAGYGSPDGFTTPLDQAARGTP